MELGGEVEAAGDEVGFIEAGVGPFADDAAAEQVRVEGHDVPLGVEAVDPRVDEDVRVPRGAGGRAVEAEQAALLVAFEARAGAGGDVDAPAPDECDFSGWCRWW
ncbi:hypothetical protein I3215_07215 [Streptomyces sp. RB110-1]|uniref:hypothetical protein n=1 Tax=unclassified Streptomyces TaxID=2593676 RepID=UPI001901651D|nr:MULTISPECIES: hypothetical protein [unclassified Streptomyces]MBK0372610.1 hypothetical protein [Streptomyces sp. RB110-1]MBK0372684.1 hypothetical protein [Streptomyces sp. RB110-1]MBK0384674.1 hypothetical protein [Streptomyces sp. RB110-2]MBK0390948.1 hypothetical protein [Streptomyces sp. RB110-2]